MKEEKVNLKAVEQEQNKSDFWKQYAKASGENRYISIDETRKVIVATNWRFEEKKGFDGTPLVLDVLSVDGEETALVEEKDEKGQVIKTHPPELSMTATTFIRGVGPIIKKAEEEKKSVIHFSAKKVKDLGRTKYDVEEVKKK